MPWTPYDKKPTIDAKNFVGTLSANVDNDAMTDAEFRDFVSATLPIVEGAFRWVDPVYEVGDTVRVQEDHELTGGKEGTVIEQPTLKTPKYEIDFHNGFVGFYNPQELELVNETA